MSIPFYDTSIVPVKQALTSLANIIRKGEEHANGANFLTASLHDDMKPLSFQICLVVGLAEKLVARATDTAIPDSVMELASFAEAHALIERGLKAIDGADKATITTNAEKVVEVGMGPGVNFPMRVDNYAHAFTIPNIYFHVVTAYAILRKEGVPLGKIDYLGTWMGPYLPQKE
ncbi:hypothetical protein N7540_012351 [Penicillium herquei]|nr:hypothetical protein N7540_012351 [Penicillium herquei]